MSKKDIIWTDRKRIIFGLPWSFTKYSLTSDKLTIATGFFNSTEEEVLLYRIKDSTLKRSFGQKLFGLGTIHFCSLDSTTPEFSIVNIKNSKEVKELISDSVKAERERMGISQREIMFSGTSEHFDGDIHV